MEGLLHILFVEDQPLDAELCQHELQTAGIAFEAQRVQTRESFERALAEFAPDLILCDFSMPTDLDGFLALEIAREKAAGVPFVFVSGTIGEERAVEAMKAGATDYVLKHRLQRLGPVVQRALREAQHRRSMQEAQEKLTWLAWHDPVTGLANRELLRARLSEELQVARREGRTVAALVWDVKRFRTINDSFGRDTGDALLREVAWRLGQRWPQLTHIARLSADYFGAYIVDPGDAAQIARLLESSPSVFAEPFSVNGQEIGIGVTVGVAVFPHDGTAAEGLLSNAEAALRQAKARGEPYLFYEAAMNARVAERLSLESRLRRGLDKHQFVLHYQPKIELATGNIAGFEALIRWNDPAGGLMQPAQFIPLLEETGLILDVGRWAICKAAEDWKERVGRGRPTPRIAVNVSAMQLHRSDFIDVVAKAIEASGNGPHGIDLEITESLLMEDIAANAVKLQALKEMGVGIAIDDFGTGYSSLSYLAKLPVDALKIDHTFIKTLAVEQQSMTIVSTIISLAHTLKMIVVAEGVETREQSQMLHLLRCEQVQGYYYAKPLPWADVFQHDVTTSPSSA